MALPGAALAQSVQDRQVPEARVTSTGPQLRGPYNEDSGVLEFTLGPQTRGSLIIIKEYRVLESILGPQTPEFWETPIYLEVHGTYNTSVQYLEDLWFIHLLGLGSAIYIYVKPMARIFQLVRKVGTCNLVLTLLKS